MNVLGIRWLGVPAERYDEMVAFLRDGLGLAVEFEEEGTTELSLANGDRVQVFAPGHRYYELFGTGPVPLFEVERRTRGSWGARAGGDRDPVADRARPALAVGELPRARRKPV
jgi:hypothetical protein